jgi:hypothetical protein
LEISDFPHSFAQHYFSGTIDARGRFFKRPLKNFS